MAERTFSFQNTDIPYYNAADGYGFVTEEHREKDELLRLAELNSGFDVPYWYRGVHVTDIRSDGYGCYVDSGEITARVGADAGRLVPLCFKAGVPCDGNYEVEVRLYGSGEILVFAGARRLVYKKYTASAREIRVRFLLNVCEIIPRGTTSPYEHKSVDVAVLGRHVRLSSLSFKSVDCPTLYIAGDSTVTDQPAEYPYSPGTSYAGWGQMLGAYVRPGARIAVSNHSHSGLTVESFRSEGHYAIVQSHMKPGDYLFLQFGHNDQKLMHLKAKEGYRDGLSAYLDEAASRGVFPVIVTPLARNSWKADDGTYNDLLEEYALECLELGRRRGVPVVDLHAASMDFIVKKGLEAAKPYFYPKDFTHTNDYGAYKMAGFVVRDYLDQIKEGAEGAYAWLAQQLTCAADGWETDVAEDVPDIPEPYRDVPDPEQGAPLFDRIERPDDVLTRVEALELVIRAARFFPTNVFNDVYDDIVGHEWYAGTVQCAYQNGIIPPQMTPDRKFLPDNPVTLEEFLVLLIGGFKSRKKLPEEKPCASGVLCSAYAAPYVRAACSLGVASPADDWKGRITRGKAARICMELDI